MGERLLGMSAEITDARLDRIIAEHVFDDSSVFGTGYCVACSRYVQHGGVVSVLYVKSPCETLELALALRAVYREWQESLNAARERELERERRYAAQAVK